MQHLEVSGAVRPLKWSLGVKWLILSHLRHALWPKVSGFQHRWWSNSGLIWVFPPVEHLTPIHCTVWRCKIMPSFDAACCVLQHCVQTYCVVCKPVCITKYNLLIMSHHPEHHPYPLAYDGLNARFFCGLELCSLHIPTEGQHIPFDERDVCLLACPIHPLKVKH